MCRARLAACCSLARDRDRGREMGLSEGSGIHICSLHFSLGSRRGASGPALFLRRKRGPLDSLTPLEEEEKR